MGMPEEVITLVDEEGEEHDFEVIDVIEVEGEKYAILLPVLEGDESAESESEDDDESGEAIILKFARDEEENEFLVDIEDDEEWEKVAAIWEEMLSEEEDA